jgi:hypothetical protein
MGDAEYYRDQADFCVQMAKIVQTAEDQGRWLKLAGEWRELAERAENGRAALPRA